MLKAEGSDSVVVEESGGVRGVSLMALVGKHMHVSISHTCQSDMAAKGLVPKIRPGR